MRSVPKIIHQIWIGPKPLPPTLEKFTKTWINNHPSWEYKFWGNKEVETLNFPEKHLLEKCANLGIKSDILRYVILYKFGGLYVDTDMECLRPFDDLIKLRDKEGFVAPVREYINNGMIASIPNSKFMEWTLKKIQFKPIINELEDTLTTTGPRYLNHIIHTYVKERVKILISEYFHSPVILDKVHAEKAYSLHYYTNTWMKEKIVLSEIQRQIALELKR